MSEEKQDEIISFGKDLLTKQFQNFFLTSQQNSENLAKALAKLTLMVEERPDTFLLTKLDRGTTTATAYPVKPDISFDNPLDKNLKVMEITILPDSSFKTKGLCKIQIDGNTVFEVDTVADLTDITEYNVPLEHGKTIKRQKKVEVFLKTSDATSSILTVFVTFGE